MARADHEFIRIRTVPLSQLFADPVLRAAFKRAEDDGLNCSISFAMPPARPRTLDGGAAEIVRELELA
jgi:hypothetical protein